MNNISFIINVGKNNLEYLKLLLKSVKENLCYDNHEILIFVDRDNEGIVDYLNEQKTEFKDLRYITHKMPGGYVGYQLNINILVKYAKHDIISYLQSDMIVCKEYDRIILEELEENCVLSATRIEPPLHPPSDKTFTMNFGLTPSEFRWYDFLNYAEQVKSDKTIGYFFAPFTFHRNVWEKVNGHDSWFRRSREDSDILQKFIHNGIMIKQTFKANVYHFTCVSSRGVNWYNTNDESVKHTNTLQQIADNLEMIKFIRKWGWFNHGESPLKKWNVDLFIKNSNNIDKHKMFLIEPFFSKVWLDDEKVTNDLVEMNNDEAIPNTLIGISEPEWNEAKKFYNTTDFSSIYKYGIQSEFPNILISVDASNQNWFSELQELTSNNIHQIIETMNEGEEYRYDNISIVINKKITNLNHNLQLKNPEFDYTLLEVH